jgi:uncharacterized protein (UPF0297 family)
MDAACHGPDIRGVATGVYEAIRDKGVHDPVCRIAGYLLSGEPAQVTAFRGVRDLIQSAKRREILTELARACFAGLGEGPAEPNGTG